MSDVSRRLPEAAKTPVWSALDRSGPQLAAVVVALLAVVLFTAPGRGYWVIDPDASAYVGLARSIAAGDGYTLAGTPHAKFPPGFPMWLSLAIFATGDPAAYAAMRDLVTLAGLIAVALVYPVGRRLLGFGAAGSLALTVAAATSIFSMQYCVAFLRSETLYTALFLAGLLAAERWRGARTWRHAALSGVFLGLSIAVRTAGVAAVPAVAAALLLDLRPFRVHYRWRDLGQVVLFTAIAALPAATFAARNAALPEASRSSGYLDELLAPYALDLTKDIDLGIERIGWFSPIMGQRIQSNLAVLALSLGKFTLNSQKGANLAVDPRSPPTAPRMRPTGYALLGLLLLGLLQAARANRVVLVLAATGYIALYLIWPFNQQQRFYMPAQSLLLGLMALGCAPVLRASARAVALPVARWPIAVLTLAIAAVVAIGRSDQPTVLGRYSREYAAMVAAVGFAAVVAIVGAVALRRRALDADRLHRRGVGIAGAMLLALWTLGAFQMHRDLRAEHAAFLADRATNPVDDRFSRIKADPQLIHMFTVLLEHARPGDLVMSDIPKIIHLATGLDTTPAKVDTRTGEIFLEQADGRRARFVYISRELPAIYDTFARHRDRFRVLYEIPLTEGDVTIPVCLYEVVDR